MDISINSDFNWRGDRDAICFSKLDFIVTTLTPRPEDQKLDSIDQTLQDTSSVRSSHTVPIPFSGLFLQNILRSPLLYIFIYFHIKANSENRKQIYGKKKTQ